MAIDMTKVDNEQTPPRWRINARYLVGTDTAQLALLNAEDRAFYQYVDAHVPAVGSPDADAGLVSISLGVNAVIGFGSMDPDVPLVPYYSLSDIVNYGALVTNVPTDAVTLATNVNNTFTIANAGFVAGKNFKVAVRLDDAENEGKGTMVLVDCIIAPAAPTNIAATGGVGSASVAWDAMDGAASYMIYWKSGGTGLTASQILAAPTGSVAGTTPAGQAITLVAGDYSFTVRATNPGGTSAGGTADGDSVT